jgi:hypothetical protein
MFRESLTVGEEANIDNLGLSGVNWRGAMLTKTVDVSHVLRDDSRSRMRFLAWMLARWIRICAFEGHMDTVASRTNTTNSCYAA